MNNRKIHDAVMRMVLSDPASLLSESDSDVLAALEYLAAKGYVKLDRAWGKDVISISATPKSQTYFPDAEARRREKLRENIRYGITTAISLAALVVAIIAIVLQYSRC